APTHTGVTGCASPSTAPPTPVGASAQASRAGRRSPFVASRISPGCVRNETHDAPRVHRMSPVGHGLPPLGVPPMTVMTCRDVIEFLSAYLDGELAAGGRETFEAHLAEGPDGGRSARP